MRIIMSDGRVIEGTPLQIVDFMRSIAFVPVSTSIAEYVRATADQARTLLNVELGIEDGSDEEMAKALIRELVANGLAQQADLEAE